jgi:hypothetical protein
MALWNDESLQFSLRSANVKQKTIFLLCACAALAWSAAGVGVVSQPGEVLTAPPAGAAGAISVFASQTTQVVIDANGYFQ